MEATITASEIGSAKGSRRLFMVTAADEPSARLADSAGVDIVLVGDSLRDGRAREAGHPDDHGGRDDPPHPRRRRGRAAGVAGGGHAVRLVSDEHRHRGRERLPARGRGRRARRQARGPRFDETAAIVAAGIPVVGHIGLTPQSLHRLGGYRVQGRDIDRALSLIAQATALERAGAFLLVLEAIPPALGAAITRAVAVPTIGIGAGPDCDGQVLVFADVRLGFPNRLCRDSSVATPISRERSEPPWRPSRRT